MAVGHEQCNEDLMVNDKPGMNEAGPEGQEKGKGDQRKLSEAPSWPIAASR